MISQNSCQLPLTIPPPPHSKPGSIGPLTPPPVPSLGRSLYIANKLQLGQLLDILFCGHRASSENPALSGRLVLDWGRRLVGTLTTSSNWRIWLLWRNGWIVSTRYIFRCVEWRVRSESNRNSEWESSSLVTLAYLSLELRTQHIQCSTTIYF